MPQATLRTDRLILRPRGPEDLDACYAMNMEPGTLDHVDFPRAGSWQDEAAHKAFLAETLAHPYPAGLGYWTVTGRGAARDFLGWVLMAPEALKGPEIEIGWRFTTAARGKGFATEAARALLTHGFDDLEIDGVIADMYRANTASMRVAAKLGMTPRADPVRTVGDFVLWELPRAVWAART